MYLIVRQRGLWGKSFLFCLKPGVDLPIWYLCLILHQTLHVILRYSFPSRLTYVSDCSMLWRMANHSMR
ncbi:hypothetical protein MPLDJ20_80227 [Mesorhizobium plurifarium]|uniref:Uncharacterized protein n=1 Tax=Mesorhizobium plurifarium TaxID=69974 RepID=A0A090FWN7_MESPL|nr:hypothetical protein MPLDJ20_80227 [Mesorhizobium plurifarium]